jgi:hypothetical protein
MGLIAGAFKGSFQYHFSVLIVKYSLYLGWVMQWYRRICQTPLCLNAGGLEPGMCNISPRCVSCAVRLLFCENPSLQMLRMKGVYPTVYPHRFSQGAFSEGPFLPMHRSTSCPIVFACHEPQSHVPVIHHIYI